MASKAKTGGDAATERRIKRPKPAPFALEPRFVFDAAAVVEAVQAADRPAPDVVDRALGKALQSASLRNDVAPEAVGAPQHDQGFAIEPVEDGAEAAAPHPIVPGTAPERSDDQARTAERAIEKLAVEGSPTTLYIVDGRVNDIDSIVWGLPSEAMLVLDPTRDGVEQINAFLADRSGVSTLALITDGGPGRILLGATELSSSNIDGFAAGLTGWASAMSAGADILLLGCDVARGPEGDAFIARLANYTGADVAASDDLTGAAALGGDLVLERQTGTIEAASTQSIDVLAGYSGTLAISSFAFSSDTNNDNILTTAERAAGFNFTFSNMTAGGSSGTDVLILVKSGTTLVYWESFAAPTSPFSLNAANLSTLGTGTLTFQAYQGKVVTGAQTSSGAYTGSAVSYPAGFFNFNSSSATANTANVTASTTPSASDGPVTIQAAGATAPTLSFGTAVTLAYTENAAASRVIASETNLTLSDVDSSTLSSADAVISANYQSGADTLGFSAAAFASNSKFTATWNSGTGTLSLALNAGQNAALTEWRNALASITYSNSSDAPTTTARTVTFRAYDATSTSNFGSATATVNVTAVNDAPVLDGAKSPVLTAVAQTAGDPVGQIGTLVSSLVTTAAGGNVTDVDSASIGIALTALDQTNGTWWLSTNNGTNWSQIAPATIASLSATNAMLLDPTARLYFKPNGAFAGTLTNALTFHAWDKSSGTAGSFANVGAGGGATAFSTASDTASIAVRPSYSLTSPDSAFATLLVGNRFDPSEDTQANSSDLDLYGQNATPLLYGGYDATSNDLYFRVRIDNPTLSKGVPTFRGVVLMGVDATGDGKIDIFIGVDGRNSGLGVVTFDPGSDLNISPSTTSITNQRSLASGGTTQPATTGFYNYALAGADLGGDGNQDAALTFRVPFAMLESRLEALLAAKGVSYNLTPGSTVSYVLLTLTQNNSINGDIGGVGKLTKAQQNITYADLGILQPVSFAAPALTNVSGSVTYTENAVAVRLAPTATLTDLDSPIYGGGRIAVTLAGAQTGDTLSFAAVGGITTSGSNLLHNGVVIGTISSSSGSITVDFSGTASKAAVEAALQALSFSSTSDNPGSASRTASFVVTDPEANVAATRTVTVFVTPTNDAPTVTTSPASRTVNNGVTNNIGTAGLANALLLQSGTTTNALIADVDAGSAIVTATLSVPVGVIEVYNGTTRVSGTASATFGGVTVTGSGTGTVVLSGTISAINSFLAGQTTAQLLFQAGSSAANGQQVTVTLAVNDLGNAGSGGALTGSATFTTVTIAGAPVLAGAFSGSVREDNNVQGGNLVFSGSILANGVALSGSTVTFLGNTAGSTALGNLSYNATTGTWTYTVSNSLLVIQQLAAGGAIEESFSISALVNGTPTTGYIRVTIDGINDAPTLTVSAVNPTFTELASPSTLTPVDIFSSPSLATFEANQLIDRVTITVGSIGDGETEFVRVDGSYIQLLAGTTTTATNGYTVTVTVNGTTATLTIDMAGGIGTAAAATLIDNLAYLNTAEILATSTRTVTVASVRDTGGTANGGQDTATPNFSSTITLAPLNDAPVLATGTAALQSGRNFVLNTTHLLANDPDNSAAQLTYRLTSTPQFGTLQYSADGNSNWTTITPNLTTFTQADIDAGRVRYVANSGVANGSVDNLAFTVTDGALSGSGSLAVTISSANRVPIAFDSTATTFEDTTRVFTFADFLFSDADDGDSLSAVQIAATPLAGALQYNNSGTWTAVTAGQIITAADIAAGRLRFVPAANANGENYATFEFKVYDSSNAVSADTAVFTVDVTSVNDAPAGADKTVTLVEDGSYSFTAGDFGFTDASDSPANSFASVVITTLPSVGTLKLSGVAVTAGQVIAAADIANLTYQPAANGNGTGYSSFTFQVRDNGGTANGGVDADSTPNRITFNVTAVNDAPVAGNDSVTTAEDASVTFDVRTNDTDVDGNSLTVTQINGTAISVGSPVTVTGGTVSLNADGTLTFTPSANFNGTPSFTYTVSDGQGGTATATVNLTVTAANDAPVNTVSGARTTAEDTPLAFTGADTISVADIDGGALTTTVSVTNGALSVTAGTGVTITGNGSGSIQLSGTAAQINAALAGLSYQPASNYHGPATLTVVTSDGTATDTDTVAITVTPVNDAPDAVNDTVTMAEDTPVTFDVRTNDTDADNDSLTVTHINGSAISTGGSVAATGGTVTLDADGRLTFTPSANFNGPTSFTYTVSDGQGGADTATVNLTITAVNDAPTASNDSVTTLEDTAVVLSAGDFGSYADVEGTAFAGVRITTLPLAGTLQYNDSATATPNWVAVTTNQDISAADLAAGRLRFVPAANANGAGYTSIGFKVSDGTAVSDVAYMLTVDVTAVNDAPQGANKTITIDEDSSHSFAASDFGFSDANDGPADSFASVIITSMPAAGTLKLGDVDVHANDVIAVANLGQLVFAPAANASGAAYATIGFKVMDNGFTANGGADTDPTANTITFNVAPVNDAPTLGAVTGGYTDTAADDSFTPLTGTLAGSDIDAGATLSYGLQGGTDNGATVSFVGTYGTLTVNKATGAYTYAPNDVAIEARKTNTAEVFTLTVSDGAATGTATFTVSITGGNDTPELAASVTTATLTDTAAPDSFADIDGTLMSRDRDAPETLTLTLAGSAADWSLAGFDRSVAGSYGTLFFNSSSGAYRFIADAVAIDALAAGESAAPTFTFTVSDASGATDSETLTINISGANDAPIAVDDSFTTAEDAPLTFDVRTNDGEVDGGTLAVTHINGTAISTGGSVNVTGGSVALESDGRLTFTPTADYNGSPSFSYTVSDGQGGSDTATVTLTVTAVNDAPTLGAVSRTITDTAADDSYDTLTGSLSGGDVDSGTTLTYGIQGGSDGGATVSIIGSYGTLTINKSTGAYSFVPSDAAIEATKSGVSDDFTITISDGTATTTAAFTVNIAGTNDTPALDHAIPGRSATVGAAFTYAFASNTFSDRDNDTLSYTATLAGGAALPAWLSFNATTRTFAGTPPMGSAGGYDIEVTASDGAATATDTFRLTVGAANQAPVNMVPAAQTVAEDASLSISGISVTDGDDDLATTQLSVTNGTLTVSLAGGATISSGANGASTLTLAGTEAQINAALATLSYQGNADFAGSDTLTIVSTDDDSNSDTDTVAISVTPVNDAPSGTDKTITIAEDGSYAFAASDFGFADASDSPANALAAVVVTTLPGAGTLTLDGAEVDAGDVIAVADLGKLVFAPAAHANGTAYATLGFKVVDDGGTANGGVDTDPTANTVTFTVTPVNDAPDAVNDTVTTAEDTPVTFDVRTNETDVDNDSLTVTHINGTAIVTGGSVPMTGGTVTLDADGRLTFTPGANFNGTPSFTYTVSDGQGGSDTATVSLTVTPVNDAPANTVSGARTTAEDTALAFTGADTISVADVDGGPLTATVSVTNGTLSVTTGGGATITGDGSASIQIVGTAAEINAALAGLTYQPASNFHGSATLTVSTTDGTATDTDTIAITVTPVNDAPAGTSKTVTINEDATYDFAATDFGFSDANDSPADGFAAVVITSVPTVGTLKLDGVAVEAGDEIEIADLSRLVFTPAANANGAAYATIGFKVVDDGGTADGGADTDPTANTITFNVTAVNDAPTLGAVTRTIADTAADDMFATLTGTFAGSDIDAGTTLSYGLQGGTDDGATVSKVGIYGTLTVNKTTGAYTYAPSDAAIEARKTDAADVFTVTVSDGTASASSTVTIDIAGANDTPELTASVTEATLADTAGLDSFTPIDGTLSSSDRDNPETLTYSLGDSVANSSVGGFDRATTSAYGTLYFNSSSGAYRFVATAAAINTLKAGETPTVSFAFAVVDGSGATASETLVVSLIGANDTPDAVNDSSSTSANNAVTIGVLGNDSDVDGDTLAITHVAGQAISVGETVEVTNGTVTLNADNTLTFAPASNYVGSASFSYTVSDGQGGTDTATVTLAVGGGAAPVNMVPASRTVLEDGTLAFAGADAVTVADSDSSSLTTTITVTNGTLNVAMGGGATITGNGSGTIGLSGTAAQINAALEGLTYRPTANYHGAATLTVTTSDGVATDTDTVAITVTPVNDAPAGADVTITATEDTEFTFTIAHFGFADPSDTIAPDAFDAVIVTTLPAGTAGTIELDGVAVAAGQSIARADIEAGKLKFVPAAHVNGAAAGSFTFQAVDDGGTANGGIDTDPTPNRITIDIVAVNDAPDATDDSVTTAEDTPVTFDVLGNDTDADGDMLVVTQINGAAIVAGGSVAVDGGSITLEADGRLTFTPAANADGSYGFSYTISDGQGGTATATVSLTVTAVSDAPAGADKTISITEDGSHIFAATDFGFSDGNDSPADDLAAVIITSLPTAGTLKLDGVDVQANDAIAVADLGKLVFAPAAHANGTAYATLGFKVVDDGGTANGGVDTDPTANTITFTVTPVNDAPTLGAVGRTVVDTAADDTFAALTGSLAGADIDAGTTLSYGIAGGTDNGTTVSFAGTYGTLTVNKATGAYSYAPNDAAIEARKADTADVFTITTSDGSLSGSATFTVSIAGANDTPALTASITTASLPDTAAPNSFADIDGTLASSDRDNPETLAYALAGSAADSSLTGFDRSVAGTYGTLFFNSSSGAYRFVADTVAINALAAGATAAPAFTFTVTDASGATDSETLTINISGANDAPDAVNDTVTTAEDTPVTFDVRTNDTDADNDSLTVTHINGSAISTGGSVAVTGGTVTLDADGRLTFTPTGNVNGPTSFTYTVSDGQGGADMATVSLTVGAANDAPVAQPGTGAGAEDTAITGTVSATDLDGDALTFTLASGPAPAQGGLSFNADGSYRFVPAADFNGTVTFTYQANDGSVNSNVATVTLTVTPANDAPTAANDSFAVAEDGTLSIPAAGVLANDGDIDGDPLSAVLVAGPAHGTLTLGVDGSFVYTPAADYTGPDSFTYRASDGTASSPVRTVSINVTPVADAPTAAADTIVTAEDTPVTFDVRTNDGDVDGDGLTVTHINGTAISVGSPVTVTGGTVSLNAGGTLTFTPTANFNGTPSFTYTVSDGKGGSDTATVNLTVTAVNDAPSDIRLTPVGGGPELRVPENAPGAAIGPVGALDPDLGDAIRLTVDDTRFEIVDGQLKLKPDVALDFETARSVVVAITATDAAGRTRTESFTITVIDVNEASVARGDSYGVDGGTTLTIPAANGVLANDNDPDGAALSAQLVTGPANGRLTLNPDGSFTYTPNAGFAGSDSFVYRAEDGSAAPGTATVNINVRPMPVPPVVTPPVVEVPAPPPPAPVPEPVVPPPPAPPSVFAPPSETSSSPASAVPTIEAASALVSAISINPVFTDPGGYQLTVLPGGGENLVLFRGVPDQQFDGVSLVRFTVPVDAFAHTRSDQTITLVATLIDGRPLPSWLTFNSSRGLFEGVPPPNTSSELAIKVIAKDRQGREAAAVFRVRINAAGATGSAVDSKTPSGEKAAKRQLPQLLREARAANDIRGKAAKLARRA